MAIQLIKIILYMQHVPLLVTSPPQGMFPLLKFMVHHPPCPHPSWSTALVNSDVEEECACCGPLQV